MNLCYHDILSKIGEEPQWFDERAVPRFVAFSPDECADIYADEVALAEIRCQGCGRPFRVAFSLSVVSKINAAVQTTLADEIRAKELHYGDPPNIECCPAGPTMNSEPVRVLEYWHTHDKQYVENGVVTDVAGYMKWVRDPTLEVDIEPAWVKAEQ